MSTDESNTTVEYRPVVEFPGYSVGSDGSVVSHKCGRNRPLHPITTPKGYLAVSLYRGGKSFQRRVHRLVLEAFVGPPGSGEETRHIDGGTQNNSLTNLCWGTAAENADDRIRHKKQARGEAHGSAKLCQDDVTTIRALRGICTQRILARRFGVSPTAIYKIQLFRTWKHVTT